MDEVLPPGSQKGPRGPRATLDGDIILTLDFTERFWAVTFGLLVGAEAEQARQLQARGIIVDGAPNQDTARQAAALLAAALAGPLRPWPACTATPAAALGVVQADSSGIARWAGLANGVFLDALTCLVAHEAAHVIQGHAPMMAEAKATLSNAADSRHSAHAAGAPEPVLSPSEDAARQTALEMEQEADASARDALFGAGVLDHMRLPRGFAIVMAFTISLLFASSPRGLRQVMHPDLDVRLRQALEALDPERVAAGTPTGIALTEHDALWRLAAFGMVAAATQWGTELDLTTQSASWQSIAEHLFDRFEVVK